MGEEAAGKISTIPQRLIMMASEDSKQGKGSMGGAATKSGQEGFGNDNLWSHEGTHCHGDFHFYVFTAFFFFLSFYLYSCDG